MSMLILAIDERSGWTLGGQDGDQTSRDTNRDEESKIGKVSISL
jgi:hypothetical protein